ncbi:MAG: protein kinase, partial [Verrucomicrobia bacterium]|nr:protein kinase [Verrucomicrobiota bacterium]
MSNLPGMLGSFELQSAVGDAPVGTVYRAQRTNDGAPARVVVIDRNRAGDAAYRQRFLKQAQTAARIQHPNLEAVLDGGEAGGEFYLATEWIEGLTVTDWLAGHGPLPEPTALEITRCCATALKTAWDAAQLVHGGLTIEDIIVQQDGVVKLRGLALAKPQEGARLNDMRALGGALYQMLVAEPPPQPGHRLPNLTEKQPGLNPFIGDVLEKMLATDPKWAHTGYEGIIEDLAALIEGRQPPSAKPAPLSVGGGGLSLSQPPAPIPAPAPAPGLPLSLSTAPAPAAPAAAGTPRVKVAGVKAGGPPKPPPPAAGGSMQLSVAPPSDGLAQLSVSGPVAPDESVLPTY